MLPMALYYSVCSKVHSITRNILPTCVGCQHSSSWLLLLLLPSLLSLLFATCTATGRLLLLLLLLLFFQLQQLLHHLICSAQHFLLLLLLINPHAVLYFSTVHLPSFLSRSQQLHHNTGLQIGEWSASCESTIATTYFYKHANTHRATKQTPHTNHAQDNKASYDLKPCTVHPAYQAAKT